MEPVIRSTILTSE